MHRRIQASFLREQRFRWKTAVICACGTF